MNIGGFQISLYRTICNHFKHQAYVSLLLLFP